MRAFFTKQDLSSLAGTIGVLAVAFFLFNSTSNDAGKRWDIQFGFWYMLLVLLACVGLFAWNAKELWRRFRENIPARPALAAGLLLCLFLGAFTVVNVHQQHRVLSDENSWTAMALQMHHNHTGGVCNQGYFEEGSLHCTDQVTNFKGKAFSIIQAVLFYVLPANRDTALALNFPFYLASLIFFFFALYRFLNQAWIALAATAFLGAMPIYIMQSMSASTEVLYVFLLNFLLLVYALVPPDQVRWKHLLLVVAVLGLFSGTRQETIFCFIPFALYYHSFLRSKTWHLPLFAGLIILASWPAVNTMAAYRGYDFQGGTHEAHSLGNLWFNLQSNIGIMMKPGLEGALLKNPFYTSFTILWLAGTLWLLIRMIVSRKYLWGGILMGLFHLQSLVILVNVSGTFEIDINQRYVLIALPSFAWIMALGFYDFLNTAPMESNPLRRHAVAITAALAVLLAVGLSIRHQDSFQANILYRNNKLLSEEDLLNTKLKELPSHSIFIYARPWQMLCSGLNSFSENTLLGWSDQEYAKWRKFSDGNIFLVRGQDGYGNVDRNSRVVGFKTTEPIERILTEYVTREIYVNSKDFGYPLSITQILNRKGRSRFAEGLVVQAAANEILPGQALSIQVQRSFTDTLPFQWSIDGKFQAAGNLSTENTTLAPIAFQATPGMHAFEVAVFAPENDTIRITQDFFIHNGEATHLQSLQPFRQTQAWSTAQMGRSVENHTLKLQNRSYAFGIGTHANSSLTYRLDGRFQRFHAIVGLDDESACGDGAIWIVRGDAKVLYTSEVLTSRMADTLHLEIPGVQVLELETQENKNNFCDHTDWLSPWLE